MAGNTYGKLFKLTTFGESHGGAIGGIIDGCPSGLSVNFEKIQYELSRRKPGQSSIVTQRREDDFVTFFSGIFNGITTGTPIGFSIYNRNQKSIDYEHIKSVYRPSHSDFTYDKKYGLRDYRGGGRSSARETVCRVAAGSIAKQLLMLKNVKIIAYVSSVEEFSLEKNFINLDLNSIESNPIRCPNPYISSKMIDLIKKVRKSGDSVGGVISCVIKNVPIGLGEPIFNKLHAELAHAMLSINAAKGFEFGSGFSGTHMRGCNHNDIFNVDGTSKKNFSGGIQGGISNGIDIYFSVAFKPIATLMSTQITLDKNENICLSKGKGRHDPCVLPRAVPIVEAMAALVLADYWLYGKLTKL
ncbi:MAG TPA: chorismate synthase [Blattabacteriaceae bacterium]